MVIVGLVCLAMMSGAGIVASSFSFGPDPAIEVGDIEVSDGQVVSTYRNTKANYLRSKELFAANNIAFEEQTDEELVAVVVDDISRRAAVDAYLLENLSFPRSVLKDRLMSRDDVKAAKTEEELRKVIGPILRDDNSGSTEEYFDKRRRTELPQQFDAAFAKADFVTKTEVLQLAQLREQQRDLKVLRFAASDLEATVTPGEEDISRYYNANKADYMLPARVKVNYIELDKDAMVDDVVVEGDKLAEWFTKNIKKYTTPEERKVRDIVIAVDADTSDSEADDLAYDIYKKIQAGADFAAMVEKYSDDPSSKENGGELAAWLIDGQPDFGEEIQSAAFSAKVGEVIAPVEQDNAYHVLIVDEVQPAITPKLADVRELAEKDYRGEQLNKLFAERIKTLNDNILKASPKSLADVIGDLELEIQTTDWIDKGETGTAGLLQYPDVAQQAFGKAIIQDKKFSKVLRSRDREHAFVLHYNDYKPSALQTLDTVRADVVKQVTAQLAEKAAVANGKEALAKLNAGETPVIVAADTQAKLTTIDKKTRFNSGLTRSVVKKAYQLPTPTGDAEYSIAGVQDGRDYVIVMVYGASVPVDIAEAQLNNARTQLESESSRVGQDVIDQSILMAADLSVDVDPEQIINFQPENVNQPQ